jgi:hypothetical protein
MNGRDGTRARRAKIDWSSEFARRLIDKVSGRRSTAGRSVGPIDVDN